MAVASPEECRVVTAPMNLGLFDERTLPLGETMCEVT
jgi:hypothetical protein